MMAVKASRTMRDIVDGYAYATSTAFVEIVYNYLLTIGLHFFVGVVQYEPNNTQTFGVALRCTGTIIRCGVQEYGAKVQKFGAFLGW